MFSFLLTVTVNHNGSGIMFPITSEYYLYQVAYGLVFKCIHSLLV